MEKIIDLLGEQGFIAAIAAIFTGFGTLLLTGIFGLLKSKSEEKKIFFDRYFPERINAYKDVTIEFQKIHREVASVVGLVPTDRPKKLISVATEINMLYFRNMVWLDEATKHILLEMTSLINKSVTQENVRKIIYTVTDDEIAFLLRAYSKFYALLYKSLETSSGVTIINKKMIQLLKPNIFQSLFRTISGKRKKASEKFENQFLSDWSF